METQTAATSAANPHIPLLILEGKQRVEQIMRQNEAYAEECAAQERARVASAWQPIVEKLKAVWPAWVTAYLQTPDDMPTTYRHGDTEYRPLTLALPSLAPIRVYVDGNTIGYSVPRASLALDEHGDAGWQAHYWWPDWSVTRWAIQQMTDDLAVAAFQAQRPAEEYASLAAEAEQRNREAAVRSVPEPEPEAEPQSALQRARVALKDGEDEYAVVLAAVAQAEAMTRIAECLEQRLEDASHAR